MKLIPLNKNKYAKVDDEDFNHLKNFNWKYQKSQHGAGGYAVATIKMHRLITNPEKDKVTDHINHDKLDNCRSNLRIATSGQNHQNTRRVGNSGYRGVHWSKNEQKWVSRIGFNSKRYFLGSYRDIVTAAKAYNKKAKELYGRFAYLNPINST